MHEYAVTKSVINTVVEEAKKVDAKKVSKVTLVVGDLSSIVDESVQMYFDLIAEGTVVHGAQLEFKRVRAELYCLGCEKNYVKPASGLECPDCGIMGVLTDKGKEFYIESIEIEEDEDDGN